MSSKTVWAGWTETENLEAGPPVGGTAYGLQNFVRDIVPSAPWDPEVAEAPGILSTLWVLWDSL